MDAEGWDRIEAELLAEDATLPDGTVEGTGVPDWQALLDLIRRQDWRSELALDGEVMPAPVDAAALFPGRALGTLAIWITSSVRINVFCNATSVILFDFSTEDVRGGGMVAVGAFVRELGRSTGKVVKLSHEDDESQVLLTYDPTEDAFIGEA